MELFRCQPVRLFRQQPIHRPPHVQPGRVGRDIDQRSLTQFRQPSLLCFHDDAVLVERAGDFVEQTLGRGRVARAKTVGG